MHPPSENADLRGAGALKTAEARASIRHSVSDVKHVGDIVPHVVAEIIARNQRRKAVAA